MIGEAGASVQQFFRYAQTKHWHIHIYSANKRRGHFNYRSVQNSTTTIELSNYRDDAPFIFAI